MAQRERRSWTRALVPTLALAALALPLAPAGAAPSRTATATVTAAASAPSAPIRLTPGVSWLTQVVITDDAIYGVGDCHSAGCAVVRRSMEVDDDAVRLGPTTFVTRVRDGVAEQDGTLAFIRSYDSRLVLRATDGTMEVPGWGLYLSDEVIHDLGTSWLVTENDVVHLQMGEAVRNLPGTGNPYARRILGPDVVVSEILDFEGGAATVQIVATGLDPDQPRAGLSTVLETVAIPLDADPVDGLRLVGVTGETIVWERGSLGYDPEEAVTLRWHGWPAGETSELDLVAGQQSVAVTGDDVVLQHYPNGAGTSVLTWLDVSETTAATTRTTNVGSVYVEDVHGSLVAYAAPPTYAGAWLIDADGREIIADQTPLQLPAWFRDISGGNAFIGDIAWLVDSDITRGYTDGTFRPRLSVSRQQMAAFLYRMAGEPEVDASTTPGFSDVPADHPFADPIAWLAGEGITRGHGDGTFRPTGSVTRGQMAAFLARFADQEPSRPSRAPFTDVPASHTFAAEIAWLAKTGITRGNTDGTFRPSEAVNRQHMAAFLHRFDLAGLTP